MRSFRALLGPLIGSLVVLALFLVLTESPGLDPRLDAPKFHFWVVSGTSLLALVLALVVGVVGVRARDARIVFLGAGFAGLAGFFALHGLSTPGFLINGPAGAAVTTSAYGMRGAGGYGQAQQVDSSTVTAVAAQLSVLSLAAWMFAAAYVRPRDGARLGRWLAVWTAVLAAVMIAGLTRPEWAGLIPVDQDPLRWAVTALLLLLLLPAGARFLEGYRLSGSALHLVMLYVVGWLAVTQLIMILGDVFQLSWWLYHAVLLLAVMMMLVTVARQMHAGKLSSALGALLSDDAERRLAYGLRPEVRALIVATEAKDRYTAGHMQRVAAYAVRLGRALGLEPEELRVLAQAAVVHDVGKIEIPDAVLNKPGKLDDSEFDLIRSHPDVGVRIGEALGMHRSELEVIRHHHERWDGGGYPARLAGEAIPRLARVLAVVDVYDALTSDRSYRPAWSAERAARHVEAESGEAFDPACAAAWVDVLRESPRVVAGNEEAGLRGRTVTPPLGTSGAE
ncbi:MAG: HD-GYP domain-containing protein [Trueperaceae bacterium]